jgi:hypothetical protein
MYALIKDEVKHNIEFYDLMIPEKMENCITLVLNLAIKDFDKEMQEKGKEKSLLNIVNKVISLNGKIMLDSSSLSENNKIMYEKFYDEKNFDGINLLSGLFNLSEFLLKAYKDGDLEYFQQILDKNVYRGNNTFILENTLIEKSDWENLKLLAKKLSNESIYDQKAITQFVELENIEILKLVLEKTNLSMLEDSKSSSSLFLAVLDTKNLEILKLFLKQKITFDSPSFKEIISKICLNFDYHGLKVFLEEGRNNIFIDKSEMSVKDVKQELGQEYLKNMDYIKLLYKFGYKFLPYELAEVLKTSSKEVFSMIIDDFNIESLDKLLGFILNNDKDLAIVAELIAEKTKALNVIVDNKNFLTPKSNLCIEIYKLWGAQGVELLCDHHKWLMSSALSNYVIHQSKDFEVVKLIQIKVGRVVDKDNARDIYNNFNHEGIKLLIDSKLDCFDFLQGLIFEKKDLEGFKMLIESVKKISFSDHLTLKTYDTFGKEGLQFLIDNKIDIKDVCNGLLEHIFENKDGKSFEILIKSEGAEIDERWIPKTYQIFGAKGLHVLIKNNMAFKNSEYLQKILGSIFEKDFAFFKGLLEININVNAVDNEGETLLFKAVKNNNVEKVKLLLDKGANLNIGYKTPLKYVYQEQKLEMMEIFLKYGQDLQEFFDNSRDFSGDTFYKKIKKLSVDLVLNLEAEKLACIVDKDFFLKNLKNKLINLGNVALKKINCESLSIYKSKLLKNLEYLQNDKKYLSDIEGIFDYVKDMELKLYEVCNLLKEGETLIQIDKIEPFVPLNASLAFTQFKLLNPFSVVTLKEFTELARKNWEEQKQLMLNPISTTEGVIDLEASKNKFFDSLLCRDLLKQIGMYETNKIQKILKKLDVYQLLVLKEVMNFVIKNEDLKASVEDIEIFNIKLVDPIICGKVEKYLSGYTQKKIEKLLENNDNEQLLKLKKIVDFINKQKDWSENLKDLPIFGVEFEIEEIVNNNTNETIEKNEERFELITEEYQWIEKEEENMMGKILESDDD